MIPCLYEPNEYRFKSSGLGYLQEASVCEVTEERNGMFELYMEYPVGGSLQGSIKKYNIILAAPNEDDQAQPFDIYKIEQTGTLIKIYARHISYRLAYMPCDAINDVSTVSDALAALSDAMAFKVREHPYYEGQYPPEYRFTFTSDSDDVTTAFYTETIYSAKEILNSIAKRYEKDLHYDKFSISLENRGANNGVTIRSGLNILDIDKEDTTDGAYNTVCCYYYKKDVGLIIGAARNVISNGVPKKPAYPLSVVKDKTRDYDDQGTIPARIDLIRDAEALYPEQTLDGTVTLDVDMAVLWNSQEFETYKALLQVRLCDTVRIYYPEINIDAETTVEKIVYDVLGDSIKSISLSNKATDLSDTVASLYKQTEAIENEEPAYVCGRVQLQYVSSTEMSATVKTGFHRVEGAVATLQGNDGMPWLQSKAVGIVYNSPNSGDITIRVAGTGFVSAHVQYVYWIAFGGS